MSWTLLAGCLGLTTFPSVVATPRAQSPYAAPQQQTRTDAPVRLLFTDCAASWSRAVRVVMRVEAREHGRAVHRHPSSDEARVRCVGSDVVIDVGDPNSDARLQRVASMSTRDDNDKAGPRLVGLMIAEMLLAVRRDAASPSRQPAVKATAAKPEVTTRAPPQPYALSLGLTVRSHGGRRLRLWGPRMTFAISDTRRRLLLRATAVAARGSRSTALGEVQVRDFSGALAASLQWQGPHFGVEGYIAARIGWAEVRGLSSDPALYGSGSARGAWGGPAIGTTVRARLGSTLLLSLASEVGWSLAAVVGRVDEHGRIGLHRQWLAAHVGVGFAL